MSVHARVPRSQQHAMVAQAALARGDLVAARRWADDAVVGDDRAATCRSALTDPRSRGDRAGRAGQAERDAHDALACAADIEAHLRIPDILECLADLAAEAGSHREAARLFGAADAIRQRIGRGPLQDLRRRLRSLGCRARDAMGEEDFDGGMGRGRGAVHRGSDRLRPARPRRTQTAHQRLGVAHPDRARRGPAGQRGARPTKTSPRGFSSHHAPCKPTSRTSTPNSASPPACSSPKKQPATRTPEGDRTQADEDRLFIMPRPTFGHAQPCRIAHRFKSWCSRPLRNSVGKIYGLQRWC